MDELERDNDLRIGNRVQIAAHYDMWMRGARFGEIIKWRIRDEETHWLVKLDNYHKPLWFIDVNEV